MPVFVWILLVLFGLPLLTCGGCVVCASVHTSSRSSSTETTTITTTAAAATTTTATTAATTSAKRLDPADCAKGRVMIDPSTGETVHCTGPTTPGWVATIVKLPSSPKAIKPTTVNEGTGQRSNVGGLEVTSLSTYDYDLPPLKDVVLAINPADRNQYRLSFGAPKSFDATALAPMKKLCDMRVRESDPENVHVFKVAGQGPIAGACVKVADDEEAEDISIESIANMRRVEGQFGESGNVERCLCP